MKLTNIFSLLFLVFLSAACNGNQPKTTEPGQEEATPPLVGNDRDEHGCIASAGYMWSALRNECIRIFETGIRLDAQEAVENKTLAAFLVFKSEDDDSRAEVFMPGENAPRLFVKQEINPEGDAGTWKSGDLTVNYWKGMYMLEDAKKQVLYQGMWDNK